jgi:hypothetical protein
MKHHVMYHFLVLIEICGLRRVYWTVAHEAKHKHVKQLARSNSNNRQFSWASFVRQLVTHVTRSVFVRIHSLKSNTSSSADTNSTGCDSSTRCSSDFPATHFEPYVTGSSNVFTMRKWAIMKLGGTWAETSALIARHLNLAAGSSAVSYYYKTCSLNHMTIEVDSLVRLRDDKIDRQRGVYALIHTFLYARSESSTKPSLEASHILVTLFFDPQYRTLNVNELDGHSLKARALLEYDNPSQCKIIPCSFVSHPVMFVKGCSGE